LWLTAAVMSPAAPASSASSASSATARAAPTARLPSSTRAPAPLILYTDLLSGPDSGGEDDAGAYLSVFGKYFGDGGLGKRVKVYIGGIEVARYLYLGPSRGRADVEQISVQIGHRRPLPLGVPLPIEVRVDGRSSNTDHTFTVNPGRLLYVDNVHGDDATAVIGDIHRPFRHVQNPHLSHGAWSQARPGDIIVMLGTGQPWTDVGYQRYFIRFRDKSGSAPTGHAGTGPIVLMGYPGEDVDIRGTLARGMSGGCISAINGDSFPGMGQWVVISDLSIDCEGYDGPISEEIHGNHWRVVNNDLAASTAPTRGPFVPRMAGITGNGYGSVWLGNHIHDIQGAPQECHGIYIDGDGTYDIAYNWIEHIRSGNGFQTYSNGTNGSATISHVRFHHNLIEDVSKHGINIADGSKDDFLIYDNVVSGTDCSGIRFNTTLLRDAIVADNTFYDTDRSHNRHCGGLSNDWTLIAHALILENNIFFVAPGTPYAAGSVGFSPFPGTAEDNLFFGGSGAAPGTRALLADPNFVDAAAHDFHLRRPSPAIGAGSRLPYPLARTDYAASPRDLSEPDIGALIFGVNPPAASR
jgi:hypothetical protein